MFNQTWDDDPKWLICFRVETCWNHQVAGHFSSIAEWMRVPSKWNDTVDLHEIYVLWSSGALLVTLSQNEKRHGFHRERERESGWSVWESQSMWEPQEIIHGISMLRPLDGAEKRSYHLRQGVSKCFKYTTQREINSTLPMYRCILHQPRLLWVGGKLWLRNPLATEEYGATTHTHNTIYK